MQENAIVYVIETTELKQEKMQFTVVNRNPVQMDINAKESIEQELYKIFKKYT